MHLEILVEDQSGKRLLDELVPRIIGADHAIEEGEAWLLGDRQAVREAYPRAKEAVLATYVQDSICGTWEKLADAVHPGGATKLRERGWQAIGAEKSSWASSIAPHMDVQRNVSPSFQYLRDNLRDLVTGD